MQSFKFKKISNSEVSEICTNQNNANLTFYAEQRCTSDPVASIASYFLLLQGQQSSNSLQFYWEYLGDESLQSKLN